MVNHPNDLRDWNVGRYNGTPDAELVAVWRNGTIEVIRNSSGYVKAGAAGHRYLKIEYED
jgi:hypothetical protein